VSNTVDLKVGVSPGEVIVNRVYVAAEGDDHLVLIAELGTEYAQITEWSENTVVLATGKYAPKDGPARPTLISIDGIPRGWDCQVIAHRYDVRMMFWKQASGRDLWVNQNRTGGAMKVSELKVSELAEDISPGSTSPAEAAEAVLFLAVNATWPDRSLAIYGWMDYSLAADARRNRREE
jgi:hypothetical protein